MRSGRAFSLGNSDWPGKFSTSFCCFAAWNAVAHPIAGKSVASSSSKKVKVCASGRSNVSQKCNKWSFRVLFICVRVTPDALKYLAFFWAEHKFALLTPPCLKCSLFQVDYESQCVVFALSSSLCFCSQLFLSFCSQLIFLLSAHLFALSSSFCSQLFFALSSSLCSFNDQTSFFTSSGQRREQPDVAYRTANPAGRHNPG